MYICDSILLNIPSSKMNTSSWRKAVDLVAQGTQANQQVQAAATAESNHLGSLPLSALSADDSGLQQVSYGSEQPVTDNCGTLQNQITSEVDKYLQEVVERHERDVNYFDGWHMATNTSSPQQTTNFVEQDDEHDEVRVPESNGHDTGKNSANHPEHYIQYQDELETI